MNKNFKIDEQKFIDAIKRSGKDVSVHFGGVLEVLKSCIIKEFPHQNVLFILKDGEQIKHKTLIETLIENDVSVHVQILEEKPISVENVSVLFTYPESIRAVICFSETLFDYATYYSRVTGAKLYVAPSLIDFSRVIRHKIKIQNGNHVDEIKFTQSTNIVFDVENINSSNASLESAYETAVSFALSLIEYRLMRVIKNKKTYKDAYNQIKECVTEVFDLTAYKVEDRKIVVAYYTLLACIADYSTSNDVLKDTTISAYFESNSTASILEISTKILRLAKLVFIEGKRLSAIPDYLKRAEFLEETFKISKAQAISNFLQTAKFYKLHEKQIVGFLQGCAIEIDGIIKSLITARRIVNNLGERSAIKEKSESVIKYLGDIKKDVNLCTLLRETGVLEQI